MPKRTTLSGVWIATAASVLGGCSGGVPEDPGYPPVELSEGFDPWAGERNFMPWRPPRQMAAFVHPHEDRAQGIMIGGHWIVILLGEGSWYFEPPPDREPVPDREASAEDIRRALGAVLIPQEAVIPFRPREGPRP